MGKSRTIIYLREDETAFLNVDVDVFSRFALEPLAAALGDKVSLHYVGRVRRGLFQFHFALYSPLTADAAIRGLVRLIRSLPRTPRRLWSTASKRVFDAGFQGGYHPSCSEFSISDKAVAAIADLGGSLKITIYVSPAVAALARDVPRKSRR